MAVSCVSYLCASLELVDERTADSENTQKVLDSFYGLHLYANEHWTQHLLACDNGTCSPQSTKVSPLYGLMERFINKHNEQLCSLYREDGARLASILTDVQDPQAFLSRYQIFREGLKKQVGKTGEGNIWEMSFMSYSAVSNHQIEMERTRIESDITLFSIVDSKYHSYVQGILEKRHHPHISKETLARFKHKYEATAYVCRFIDCPKRSSGFGNVQARNDHESLRHGKGILCSQALCLRSKVGFKNSQSLKRHMQETHESDQSVNAFKRPKFRQLEHLTQKDQPIESFQPDAMFLSNGGMDMSFASDIDAGDVLEQFDFDAFLENGDAEGFNIDRSLAAYANFDGLEASTGDL